ncbi:MAG: hypothetical protein ACE15E_03770 [Acidobacteriota bacterium]
MLKITVVGRGTEQRLVLEGRLAEEDVSELQSAWERVRRAVGLRACVVDLRNVTFIHPGVERVLVGMHSEGAQFIACGVANTYRLEELGIKCKVPRACQPVGGAPTR